jgi:hypothetical protein
MLTLYAALPMASGGMNDRRYHLEFPAMGRKVQHAKPNRSGTTT